MAKVLLVDDELTMVQMVAELLRQEGHEVFPFSNGSAAVAALTTHSPDLVITDLYFDKTRAHGLEVVQKARALSPPAVVIVITGFGTIETAVEAMKNGAFDYLEKPFKVDELKLCVQRRPFLQRGRDAKPLTCASSSRRNTSSARSSATRRRCRRCSR